MSILLAATSSTKPITLPDFAYLMIGGGGSGAGTGTSVSCAGGGAGGFKVGTYTNIPGEVLTITVGAGGVGGAALNTDGTAGGDSIISSSTLFPTSSFIASPAGTVSTVLTISSVTSGTIQVGMVLTGLTLLDRSANPYITSFGTFNGTSGTVNLSWPCTWANNAAGTATFFRALGGGGATMLNIRTGNGGSGGGNTGAQTNSTNNIVGLGATGISQGFNGALGTGNVILGASTGGGGGGAGGLPSGGTGGVGKASSITGSSVTYARGGNGNSARVNGPANSGNGGTGGIANSGIGGAGGSGVVILSIPTASYSGIFTGNPVVTTSGNLTVLKFINNGTYTT